MNQKLVDHGLFLLENLRSNTKENIIAFSGGKDSIVLAHLAKVSGFSFRYVYNNTTIDPPGHISFIRKYYPYVEIIQPIKSFYKLVELKGLPTLHRRWCCAYLKESFGKNCNIFEGLRYDEGIKRGKRLKLLKEPQVCDTRKKTKIHNYPLLNWTSLDIWDYIKQNNLPYPNIYDLGFKRLGCIGCPLAYKTQRIYEFKMFPKYAHAMVKSIGKNIESGLSISKIFSDKYEAFFWWLSMDSVKCHKGKIQGLTNFEEWFYEMFPRT